MKRIVSIVLIWLFLFNVIGYYGIYVAMLRHARVALNEKIDNGQLKDDQTVTIKIPMALPYPVQQDVYERVQGDFEYLGEFYKLVKQRYSSDTLYVVCTKSLEEKKAFKVLSDFVKLSTDQASAAPHSQHAKTVVSLIKDYSPVVAFNGFAPRQIIELVKLFSPFESRVLARDLPISSPPPESCC
ncbi:MAG TPA: hypothetical protein VKQ08_00630 [Cyclobacteriaceae bacterium]|nr:hypothetical protein [Cyclobacteriaceae bacterium]